MRRILLAAAITASILLPAFPAPAATSPAAPAAGPALQPPEPYRGTEAPAPARDRRRADRCAPVSPAVPARRVPFTVFAPRELPAGWIPAVCVYPPGGREIGGLRIHVHAAWTALPPAGALEPRIAGITQTKAVLPRLEARHGKSVRLRGTIARFTPWHPAAFRDDGRPVHGGILRWIERGTLIEIDSRVLTKKQMIRLAESLEPVTGPAAGSPVSLTGNRAPEPGPSAGIPAPLPARSNGNPAPSTGPSAGKPSSPPDSPAGKSPELSGRPGPASGAPFGPQLPFPSGGSILGPGDIRA